MESDNAGSFLQLSQQAEDHDCDQLALIPLPVLLNSVLPLLAAEDLLRLAACCRALRAAVWGDEVWRPRCEELGWGPFPRGVSWQAGFSSRRQMLCVECGTPSRYVFALLGCRLCEGCEHRNPRYGLVTALEAAERYGVPYAALAGLPYHEACRTRFFLRSAVEALARGAGGGRMRRPGGVGDKESEEEEEEEEEREGKKDRSSPEATLDAGGIEAEAEGAASSGSDEADDALGGGGGGAAAAERRAADKAARKAAKKAAKEAQRLKRQMRSPPVGGSGGAGGWAIGLQAHRGQARQQQQQHAGPGGGGRRRGGHDATAAPGTSPPAAAGVRTGAGPSGSRSRGGGSRGCPSPAGPIFLAAEDDGTGVAIPLEGQVVPQGRARGRAGGRGGGGGGGAAQAAAGGGGGGGASGSHGGHGGGHGHTKLKSGWAAEREALMAAWGQFGISGLVLAS